MGPSVRPSVRVSGVRGRLWCCPPERFPLVSNHLGLPEDRFGVDRLSGVRGRLPGCSLAASLDLSLLEGFRLGTWEPFRKLAVASGVSVLEALPNDFHRFEKPFRLGKFSRTLGSLMAGSGLEARFWSRSGPNSIDLGLLEAHEIGALIRFARIVPSWARRPDGLRRLTGNLVIQ